MSEAFELQLPDWEAWLWRYHKLPNHRSLAWQEGKYCETLEHMTDDI